jgi:FHA domain
MAEYPPLIYCEDRQSSNGTYVNDTLIGTYTSPRSPYLLNDGDVISIRPRWTFHFQQTKQSNGIKLNNLQTQETEVFLLCTLFLQCLISASSSRIDTLSAIGFWGVAFMARCF